MPDRPPVTISFSFGETAKLCAWCVCVCVCVRVHGHAHVYGHGACVRVCTGIGAGYACIWVCVHGHVCMGMHVCV